MNIVRVEAVPLSIPCLVRVDTDAGISGRGEACGIPIAAGEICCFAVRFAALFDAGAVQYAQPSVTKVGGITEFLKVAALAADRGVKLAPHSPYFGPGAMATLHLLAAQAEEARSLIESGTVSPAPTIAYAPMVRNPIPVRVPRMRTPERYLIALSAPA
ncbi:MAG: hypothetical protein O2979_10205 [Proteobacteria bacterium]|nr:hypothetical protein [Pseudomonadota bacterium]MDA1118353.1 hypothetical protein [Pseudomonadota bacterium]